MKNKTNHSVNVINEFVDTEEGYLRDLNTIVDDIMKPLSEKQVGHYVKTEMKLNQNWIFSRYFCIFNLKPFCFIFLECRLLFRIYLYIFSESFSLINYWYWVQIPDLLKATAGKVFNDCYVRKILSNFWFLGSCDVMSQNIYPVRFGQSVTFTSVIC